MASELRQRIEGLHRPLLTSFEEFIHLEQVGGALLLLAACAAMVWANSAAATGYYSFWNVPVGISLGDWSLVRPLVFWINEGLMAIFFFVVGVEIKQELTAGALSEPRAAALPIAAAIGGMVVPALVYLLFTGGTAYVSGWGIPTATDIAFTLGILALLGSRVPAGLKVFVTLLAIVDDIGAVLIIALFYSHTIIGFYLVLAFLVVAAVWLANLLGIVDPLIYGFFGLVIWVCLLGSGVHATLAGVALALAAPIRARISQRRFRKRIQHLLKQLQRRRPPDEEFTQAERQETIFEIEKAVIEAQPPLLRIHSRLHPWAVFVVVPLFALANAGVDLAGGPGGLTADRVMLGIFLGLLAGKPLGILLFSFAAIGLKYAALPASVTRQQLVGAALLCGVGFTMSIFIATLAFVSEEAMQAAKVAVMSASLLAGLLGWLILRNTKPATR